jgi:hypothetical protein
MGMSIMEPVFASKSEDGQKQNLIQAALQMDQMKQIGDMHDWWCEPEAKDNEPLCEVWYEYKGDTSQYHKIPKDRIPTQKSVQAMHRDYCAVHPQKELCFQWNKEMMRAEGNIDPETKDVFDWWCTDRSETNLCKTWADFVADPIATQKEGAQPSKQEIDEVNEAYCTEPKHHRKPNCKNSPWAMGKTKESTNIIDPTPPSHAEPKKAETEKQKKKKKKKKTKQKPRKAAAGGSNEGPGEEL